MASVDSSYLLDWVDQEVSGLVGQGGSGAVKGAVPGNPYGHPINHFWVSVWDDIFGKAARRPPRVQLSQTQINQLIVQNMINLHAQDQWLVLQALSDIAGVGGAAVGAALASLNASEAYAKTLYNDAIAYAHSLLAVSGSQAQGAYNAAVKVAEDLYNREVAKANSQFTASVLYTAGLYRQAVSISESLYNREETNRLATQNFNTHLAENLYNRVESDLSHNVKDLTAQMASAVNKLEMDIGSSLNAAKAFASQVAGIAEAAAIAKTLAQVQPQLDALKTETDDCLKPLCDTVTPNAPQLGKLGSLLKATEGEAWLVLLFGAIVAAVVDPEGTAVAVDDVLGPDVALVSNSLIDLIGAF